MRLALDVSDGCHAADAAGEFPRIAPGPRAGMESA